MTFVELYLILGIYYDSSGLKPLLFLVWQITIFGGYAKY